jgi:hypothetical protein
MQLRIGFLSGTWAGRYRCVVTGSCGTAISAVSTVGAPPPPCYPNCDNSTLAPTLNVQDFSCFLNSFANGETYANCDGSTIAPVLNVQDFGCFLNAFATGCS